VHLRRALLLFALVLVVTAVAASIAPPPPEDDAGSKSASTPPPTAVGDPGEQRVGLSFPPPHGKPVTRRVDPSRPLVVFVSARQDGQATIPLLGRVASVTTEDPARFDLLLSRSGSYDVRFTPAAGGEARHVGKLVTAAGR
jgi:hypothetical protein